MENKTKDAEQYLKAILGDVDYIKKYPFKDGFLSFKEPSEEVDVLVEEYKKLNKDIFKINSLRASLALCRYPKSIQFFDRKGLQYCEEISNTLVIFINQFSKEDLMQIVEKYSEFIKHLEELYDDIFKGPFLSSSEGKMILNLHFKGYMDYSKKDVDNVLRRTLKEGLAKNAFIREVEEKRCFLEFLDSLLNENMSLGVSSVVLNTLRKVYPDYVEKLEERSLAQEKERIETAKEVARSMSQEIANNGG